MAELDISPELLEELKNEFWKNYNGNDKINAAVDALRGSEGLNYKEAYNYSFEVGKSLTGAIRETARSDILPDGKMYYNIADKALRPMLENNYRLISDYCVKTQNALNERAGIGIKGVAAPINEDRVNGLLNVAAAAQQFDDIVGEFCRECENYSLSVVDEHIKKNAEIQNSAGLSPKIERYCGHSGCDWCSSLAGTYEYEKVKDTGNDVFRRHRGCTCTVVFIPINGRAENAHTKYYIPDKELIELRKNYVGVDRSGRGGIIEGKDGASATIKEIDKPLTMSDSQFGKKMGKHNDEWGIDPKKPDDGEKFKQIISDIVHNHDKPVRIGEWRGYSEETLFFIKGEDVVITTQEGRFVSILKGGISNGRVKDAREY